MLAALIQEWIDRFGLLKKEVGAALNENQNVFSDLLAGRRNFQPRHIVGLIEVFRRFQQSPADPARTRMRSKRAGFRTWTRSDEFDLLWTFVHGERLQLDAGADADQLVVRRMFTLGGHRQDALIYEFVPEGYERRNIHCAFDPAPLAKPEDPEEREQFDALEALQPGIIASTPGMFNGSGMTLSHIQNSRTAGDEQPMLTLRFKPSDYVRRRTTRALFSGLAPTRRDAVLDQVADGVAEQYCGGFGAVISIVTADRKLMFFKRSNSVAGDQGGYDCTITESADGVRDIDESGRPSVLHNAIRGLEQEAALKGHQDFIHPRLRFHGILVRSQFYEWSIQGSLDLSGTPLTAERLVQNAAEYFRKERQWDVNTTHTADVLSTTFVLARDSFEFRSYAAVSFNLADVVRFIATNPITDYAFVNAVMTLVSIGNASPTAVAKELSMYPPGTP